MNEPLKHRVFRGVSRAYGALRGKDAGGLRILMYHSVGGRLPEDPYGTSIERGLFARHVDFLSSIRQDLEPAPLGAPLTALRADKPRVAVTFDDGYKDVLATAAPLLLERKIPFTLFATSEFIRGGSNLYLNPAELKKLSRLPGVNIGSHGATHRRLDKLSDADLAEELSASKKYLEDILSLPVTSLSYPHGDVNQKVRDAAQRAGYTLAGTSFYGLNTQRTDPLLLRRTEVVAWDTPSDLELKAFGCWDWYRLRQI